MTFGSVRQATGWLPETDWLLTHHLPGRPADVASEQGTLTSDLPADLPAVQELGTDR